jgi:hypothetical protein
MVGEKDMDVGVVGVAVGAVDAQRTVKEQRPHQGNDEERSGIQLRFAVESAYGHGRLRLTASSGRTESFNIIFMPL